jgi:hypothetical protein
MKNLLYIFPIVMLALALFMKWKYPYLMGLSGEKFVSRKLRGLNPNQYKILNNLMLPSKGSLSTTQIDHVVVSNYGIFAIETKAYHGWIFGNANQEYWTQVIYRSKKRFFNPLRQNYAHTKAIENLLGAELKAPIVSFVAFPHADKLKISGTDSVGRARDIVAKIKSYTNVVYSNEECDKIINLLVSANITDKPARKSHKKGVRGLKF